MNKFRVGVGVVLGFVFSMSCLMIGARAQSGSSDAGSAEIRQVIDDFIGAFNKHDAHGWAMRFGEDGDFTNVSGLTLRGQAKVEERFKGLFNGALKNAHRTVSVRHIRFVKPDVVAADAEWALVGSVAADGTENPVRKGMFTFVMIKKDGHWMFEDFHESEFVTMK